MRSGESCTGPWSVKFKQIFIYIIFFLHVFFSSPGCSLHKRYWCGIRCSLNIRYRSASDGPQLCWLMACHVAVGHVGHVDIIKVQWRIERVVCWSCWQDDAGSSFVRWHLCQGSSAGQGDATNFTFIFFQKTKLSLSPYNCLFQVINCIFATGYVLLKTSFMRPVYEI